MKICQINCVYGVGSTGKLTRDIHLSLLQKGFDSIAITPLANQFTDEKGVYVVSNKLLSYTNAVLRRGFGMQFDWAHVQTWRIIEILKKEKPAVVHIQCLNSNDINVYILLRYLAKNKVKTLYTLHAEFPYTGGCGNSLECNRWKTGCGNCPVVKGNKLPLFDGTHRTWVKQKSCYSLFESNNLHFTAVSLWLLSRAIEAEMLKPFKKSVVMNGVDTSIFFYEKPSGTWKNKLRISQNEKILLYVTASFYPHEMNLKGGNYILELAKRLSDESVKIVVAASYGDGSNLPKNVIYVGRTETQQDLAALYREAYLSVITSKNETFGMPVAESLCCGTPIVGYRAGGPESVALQEYSEFVEYGNLNALYDCVGRWLAKQHDKSLIATKAMSKYSKMRMTREYINQYESFSV